MAKKSNVSNAPSKTGNPSGPRRGNAPTRPGKTPPPAPKTTRK
ncbi:hypothetical protein [Tenacibaculum discolor]|nr:hypothetical protein [Tenacibaculum discolor]RLK00099.1 hypothetical protein C8N27_1783 [Tenacibaculum discolor]